MAVTIWVGLPFFPIEDNETSMVAVHKHEEDKVGWERGLDRRAQLPDGRTLE